MCIAIYKPKRLTIADFVFTNSFAWHPDGAGFLAWDETNDTLICKKGYFTLDAFKEAFEPYKKHLAVIHFRKATHGEKDKENCHPFLINDELGFVHNGVIKEVKQWDRKMSDTWHFGKSIIKPLVDDFPDIWKHQTMVYLIENYITKNSKLVFLNNKGKHKIFNEKKGLWDSGCWFSNDTYKYDPNDIETIVGNADAFNRSWSSHDMSKDHRTKDDLFCELHSYV